MICLRMLFMLMDKDKLVNDRYTKVQINTGANRRYIQEQ